MNKNKFILQVIATVVDVVVQHGLSGILKTGSLDNAIQ